MRIEERLAEMVLSAARLAQSGGDLPIAAVPAAVPFSRPKKPEWGDYSTALALSLAKEVTRAPMDVAAAIQARLPDSDLVARTTVTAPGFLNFVLDPGWLARQVDAILLAGASYADLDHACGQRAQVEFVSANPTGPLTVGHGRGGVLGDSLARALEAAGYAVTREFYYNNAGLQMRRLGESLRVRYLQALGDRVEMPADGYQGEYLEAHGADLAREHGPSLRDEPWERFKDLAEARIAEGQRRTLGALGVRMDCFFNEQSLYETGAVQTVLERLRAAGYTYEQDGATWFRATALDGAEDRVVVRSTGEATYRLPDIAYHVDKLTRGYDLIVDVLGADHKDAFPDVVRGLRALGLDATPVRLLMNQFVTFRGGRMSKRAGHFATLDELLSEVGRDVARFFLLMRSAEAHLEFDLDLARDQSDTNPVYYVQYAHARICSILRMAEERGFSGEGGDVSLLVHTSETRLIRRLLDLSETIHLVVTHLAPHHLTTYARDLATDFHAFYRDCRVLDEGDRRLSSSRLRLVEAARISLARALDLLGVSAPTEM